MQPMKLIFIRVFAVIGPKERKALQPDVIINVAMKQKELIQSKCEATSKGVFYVNHVAKMSFIIRIHRCFYGTTQLQSLWILELNQPTRTLGDETEIYSVWIADLGPQIKLKTYEEK